MEPDDEIDFGKKPFIRASFPIHLNLPDAGDNHLTWARRAIRREFWDSAKWKRLRCRNARVVSESETGTIYELEIGHAVELDWSWEGAVAFRPVLLKEFGDSQATFFQNGSLDPDIDDSILWSGEVVEVDEATGRLFVVINNPEYPPRRGSFYVRPFEFLEFLDAIFNEPEFESILHHLPSRLEATRGGIHPAVDLDTKVKTDVGLAPLRSWWRKSWSILWGPPGTGKTYTLGQQVARVLSDPSERILVISTTNRSTDAAALSIGRAAQSLGLELEAGLIRRIGKGASWQKYETEGLTALLSETEAESLAQIEALSRELAKSLEPPARAMLRNQIKEIRDAMRDTAKRHFLDADVRVVVGTSFKATTFIRGAEVKDDLDGGNAPFTTVFIDEAGLMSRAAIAALSLLASRRVVLVGDSKQLAPISRISRVLEPDQGDWLAQSGLSHLDQIAEPIDGVHVLQEQRRMHPDICEVVSQFQYEGFLTTAADVANRYYQLPDLLIGQPRTIWYVLDEELDDLPSIRAERGPGNHSWTRTATLKILKKFFSDPTFRAAKGLFISPFKAQAKEVHSFFAANGISSWSASTVHSQQGTEADIVIFDSVNAGSTSWAYDEWKRLVNVAISRSRESLILLASRDELEEPYLRPLLPFLAPRIVKRRGSKWAWEEVPVKATYRPPVSVKSESPYLLGNQFATRKELHLVLSNEQERLCGFKLDGKPRLVRGVAGSGKTVVLAHWLTQTVQQLSKESDVRIWAVFANRSLESLIGDSVTKAWEKLTGNQAFPWHRVQLYHIKELLEVMLPEVGLVAKSFQYEYDQAAEAYLQRKSIADIAPRCDALFIDEAQDMGPHTLKLLSAIVRRSDAGDENSRSINIFYDNAQNIYGRSTPKWSDLGLDMRGRSTVMKESFRSTRPIAEFALNVLYRFQPPETNPDHAELVTRGLIERSTRKGADWWKVRFNQIHGPKPDFLCFSNLDQEFEAIGDYCRDLIRYHGVQPADICLIYNGQHIPSLLEKRMMPRLAGMGVELSVQTKQAFKRSSHMLLATTPHSFKGYDSEIVIIPALDQYKAHGKGVLAHSLYVAMTRARSLLTLFSLKKNDTDTRKLFNVIDDCLGHLDEVPEIDSELSPLDDIVAIVHQIGYEHRKWLVDLWNNFKPTQEPLMTKSGEIVAEPLFSFQVGKQTYACFGTEPPRKRVLQRLELLRVRVIVAGETIEPDAPKEP